MRSAHRGAVLAAFACLGGCLLTSDFDGVAGVRPEDGGGDLTPEVDPAIPG